MWAVAHSNCKYMGASWAARWTYCGISAHTMQRCSLTKIRQGSFSLVGLGHESGHLIVFARNSYLRDADQSVLQGECFIFYPLSYHWFLSQVPWTAGSISVQSRPTSFGSAECFCSADVSRSAYQCLSLLLCSSFLMKAMVMLFNALKNF